MKLETYNATLKVEGRPFDAWVHIDPCLSGFAARLTMPIHPGGQIFAARWKEGRELYLFIVGDKEWLPEIEAEGFTIIGELGELCGMRSADETT